MGYSTQSDIEDVFGIDNVRTWSNLQNDITDADTDRIARALVWADRYIDNRFRGSSYIIPLTPAAGVDGLPEIVDLSARLAGLWLYKSRPNRDAEDIFPEQTQKEVDDLIDRYLDGRMSLPAARTSSAITPTCPVVVSDTGECC